MIEEKTFEVIIAFLSATLILSCFLLICVSILLVFYMHKDRKRSKNNKQSDIEDSTSKKIDYHEHLWRKKAKKVNKKRNRRYKVDCGIHTFENFQLYQKYLEEVYSAKQIFAQCSHCNRGFEQNNDSIKTSRCCDPFHEKCYNDLIKNNLNCPKCNEILLSEFIKSHESDSESKTL